MVYNGDEVSALVVDFGSYTTRAGYAGEDTPRVVCPSFYGYLDEDTGASSSAVPDGVNGAATGNGEDVKMDGSPEAESGVNGVGKKGKGRKCFVGDDGVGVWREGMEVDSFMLDGIEPASQLLHHILHNRLSVDPSEHPLMITEPAWNTPKAREMLAQMAFEGENVPAVYFGSTGVLSAFAAGKPTALVLDVGYANSSAVPVVDGYALRAGTMRQPLAGQLLTSQLRHGLSNPSSNRPFPLSLYSRHLIAKRDPSPLDATAVYEPKPLFRDDRLAKTTDTWKSWSQDSVVEAWKEACCEVVNSSRFNMATAATLPQVSYELPDGYSRGWGEERYRYSEMLFDPKNYFDQSIEPPANLRLTQSAEHSHSLKDLVSLSQLVHDSIMACDVDVRAALLSNIVVVGNGAGIKGLTERLDFELAQLMPSQKIKIHSPTIPFEKRYAGWLGGSILASLGTFHQLWITKDEYEEHGPQIIHQSQLL